MAPRAEREAYAFPTDIYAEIDATGLASPGEIEALQRQAVRLLARGALAPACSTTSCASISREG